MKRIGVYCGSFDPLHNGHVNIINKALRIFDEVVVAIGINPDKDNAKHMYARQETIQKALPDVRVESYQGLTIDLLDRIKDKAYCGVDDVSVTLIRGLRDGYDLNYEVKTLRFNQDLAPDINVVMIICDKEFSHLSSSAIRSLAKMDDTLTTPYLP